ncbi:MAG: tRNA (adenosine(37)-N6)-threonylcarbamoyltransferase complex transferase subunit TsaD [Candidatus Sumerlaeia bacterium]|nr:tRNA (adenosine(37)-N6)-threonylcarbamoyltransferase complex transferase subunit TsaD [Candidatus Sumerlaeia bacterium]
MLVLGIESSCDETSAAVVRDGRHVLSNIVWSQVKLHAPYGGVVPELASRAHIRNISTVVDLALKRAGVDLEAIDLIAVTCGPGLVGSLLVGVEFAKALAFARNLPLVAVHHIAAHLYSPFLRQAPRAHDLRLSDKSGKSDPSDKSDRSNSAPRAPRPRYPYLGLAISGGHTSLTRVERPGEYRTLGETRDDAVGEAYDKVAKLLGLGYPGGPLIDKMAAEGNPRAVRFPRPMRGEKTLDFSFSGLKTAVLHHVESVGLETIRADRARLCGIAASFQAAVIDSLLEKTCVALHRERLDSLAVVGGVACNAGLRRALADLHRASSSRSAPSPSILPRPSSLKNLWIPPPSLCTDNAAMIAGLGYHLFRSGRRDNDLSLNADPGWPLQTPTRPE